MALLDRIGGAPLGPEPIGVRVRLTFDERIERKQMQCLHGPVAHRQDAQRAGFAVTLGDVDTPERPGPVAPVVQGLHRPRFFDRDLTVG